MRTATSVAILREMRASLRAPVGLVPTMGFLHEGHISLIRRARAECEGVIVSIFVNPLQFGPKEDLSRYPRDLPRDLQLCEENGADVVFVPELEDVYPSDGSTIVEVEHLQDRWEGATRPGHFRGVATVVAKLFRMAQPERAYFGEKDFQQLRIVQRLARDLLLDVEVVGCPIIRDPDGLALSSRNVYLGPEARSRSLSLSRALRHAQERLANGETGAAELCAAMETTVRDTPGVELDYVAVVDPSTLAPIDEVTATARALIPGHIDGVHLIDNAPLMPPETGQKGPVETLL